MYGLPIIFAICQFMFAYCTPLQIPEVWHDTTLICMSRNNEREMLNANSRAFNSVIVDNSALLFSLQVVVWGLMPYIGPDLNPFSSGLIPGMSFGLASRSP